MASLSFIRTLTAAAAAALVLTGCGTPDPHEPTELQSIHEVVKTDKEWTASVGESLTGLLAPAVTEDTVYAAGGDELYAFELATGRRLWKTDVGSERLREISRFMTPRGNSFGACALRAK